ncbi:metallophosphoesterase family protein [Nocardiopsis sp. NPDC007018]|uniref:metallophosphoesterase family protein n=1 Tax=Nocardiopsis sp. NPDC007018 TaxID=3155721 RepID=UPI0033F90942
MSATPRPRPIRHALALRTLAALGAGAVALAPAVALPTTAAAQDSPERLTLSPTADPSASQTVTWRAAHGDTAVLEIAPASDPDQVTRVAGRVSGDAGGTHYAATAHGLTPDTDYRYRVGDAERTVSDWHTFTTAASGAEPFTFLYFGDIQNDIPSGAAPVVRAALAAEPDAELAVHAGDLIDHANSDSQWGQWYDAFGSQTTGGINHLAAPGNHEYSGSDLSDHWALQFPGAGNGPAQGADLNKTVYYTDYQGVRFVVLNSNYRNAASSRPGPWLDAQQEWLEGVLEDNPQEWTVVTFHHPVFSNSPGRDNGPLRQAWLDTLEEHDVDLVLQGHDHSYSRGNLLANRTQDPDTHTGPVYAVSVTGPKMYDARDRNWTDHGAEARLQVTDTQTYQAVEVDGTTLDYVARTADGRVVDSFTIVKDDQGKRVTTSP